MACPKNKKKFLGLFSYKGEHEWETHELKKTAVDYTYRLTFECRLCNVRDQKILIEREMLGYGFNPEKLRTLIWRDDPIGKDRIEEYRTASTKSEPVEDEWGDLD